MKSKLHFYFFKAILAVLLLVVIAGCAASPAAPTAATAPVAPPVASTAVVSTAKIPPIPTASETAAPSPTPLPTMTETASPSATPISMPPMPTGPFTWKGSTRPLLMAHYMPWYQSKSVSGSWGWHWTMNHFTPTQAADGSWTGLASHYTPLIGPYDSSDEAVLEYQVGLMKISGIDGVIVDWYGSEDFNDYGSINAATGKLFTAIKKAGLKFAICYEDQTMKNMVDAGHFKADEAIAQGQKVMSYLQKTWFNDPAYLKVSGKPLLLVYGPMYFMNDTDWKSLFSVLNPQLEFITLDNHNVVGVMAGSFPWPPMWASQSGVLSHDVLLSYLNDFYDKVKSWNWTYTASGAFPGFHDIYKEANVSEGYGYLDALDGKTFRFTLQNALDHNPALIQLITWNDYGEGTNIEPTVEYQNRYLEMVQEARTVTSAGQFKFTPKDLDLPLALYTLRVKYAQDTAVTAQLDRAARAIDTGDLAAAAKIIAGIPVK